MPLLSRFHVLRQGESPESPLPQPLHRLPIPPRFDVGHSPAPDSNERSPSQCYAQMAQDLRPSLQSACPWFSPEDVELIGNHPIAAGGFSDIWEGMYAGRKVVLKSYRCYMSFNVTQVIARFYNEVHVWTLLHGRDAKAVPLLGVYSTETHPFGLVYEYMDGLDLKQYLGNDPNVGRLKLLIEIARGLALMHDLGIVHGKLDAANILVDKDGTARIAGLSNASILSHPTPSLLEGGINVCRLSHNNLPASILMKQDAHDSSLPTKVNDILGFGIIAWEVFTGRPPFFEMTEIAATHLMLSGVRPPRPGRREISDRVWYVIERCWHKAPSKRMSIGEAVGALEAELRHTPDF